MSILLDHLELRLYLLLLDFITKLTASGNYSALTSILGIIWWMAEADIDISRVTPIRIWPAISLTTLFIAFSVACFCRI